jgi:hypothetical protein
MTSITHPIVTTHHVVGVLATVAVSVAVAVTLTLALVTTNSPAAGGRLRGTDRALCSSFSKATPGSAAMFRLADQINTQGSCR